MSPSWAKTTDVSNVMAAKAKAVDIFIKISQWVFDSLRLVSNFKPGEERFQIQYMHQAPQASEQTLDRKQKL
jgi:hypothetical protein